MALTKYKHKDLKSSHVVLRTLGNTLWEISLWNVFSVQTGCSVVLPLLPSKHELRFWITAEAYTPLSESLLSKTTLWFSLEYVHSGTDQPGTYSVSKTWQVYSQSGLRGSSPKFNLEWVTQRARTGWAPREGEAFKGWCICDSEGYVSSVFPLNQLLQVLRKHCLCFCMNTV